MTDNEKRIADLELQLAGTVNNLGITIARLEDLYRIVERIAGVVSRGQTIDREDE